MGFLRPPAPHPGEDPKRYDELLGRVTAAVKPKDFLEQIWVRDVVDLIWEAFRLRRLKSALLVVSAPQGIEKILRGLGHSIEASATAKDWAVADPEAVERVDQLLGEAGFDIDSVMAEALTRRIESIERIDRLIANAEARRNAILREVERHRTAVAEALQRAAEAEEAEDAEFETLPPRSQTAEAAE